MGHCKCCRSHAPRRSFTCIRPLNASCLRSYWKVLDEDGDEEGITLSVSLAEYRARPARVQWRLKCVQTASCTLPWPDKQAGLFADRHRGRRQEVGVHLAAWMERFKVRTCRVISILALM